MIVTKTGVELFFPKHYVRVLQFRKMRESLSTALVVCPARPLAFSHIWYFLTQPFQNLLLQQLKNKISIIFISNIILCFVSKTDILKQTLSFLES
jgi:hypothetical protein